MTKKIDNLIWSPSPELNIKQRKWIENEIAGLGNKLIASLVTKATFARKQTYSPYSGYGVGAALLCTSCKIYPGFNSEIHTYSETIHAEQMATMAAVLAGEAKRTGRKFIKAIAISHSGDSAPCGKCRQIMLEHCDNALIIVADPKGKIRGITSLEILIPWAFKPSDLETK